jgi:hypothetical protein
MSDSEASEASNRALWVFIEGNSNPFELVIPITMKINQVKALVHKKDKAILRSINAAHLVLFKVRHIEASVKILCLRLSSWQLNESIPLKPEEQLSGSIKSLPPDKLERLGTSKRIGDIFLRLPRITFTSSCDCWLVSGNGSLHPPLSKFDDPLVDSHDRNSPSTSQLVHLMLHSTITITPSHHCTAISSLLLCHLELSITSLRVSFAAIALAQVQ